MKIAILSPISHQLPPHSYGPWEKDVHLLAKALTEMGEDVTVFLAGDSVELPYKVIHTVDKSLENMTEFQFMQENIHINKAASIIREGDFDVVNNHLTWNGMLALDLIKSNHVTTIHGYEAPSGFLLNHYADRKFISLTYAERKKMPNLNYVANIFNPIDFDFFELVEEKKDYIFVGARICRDKGIHNAIKLAKAVGISLVIAGRIHDQEYYEKEVLPHVDGEQIKYIGVVTQDEMKKLAGEATAYISLLEWHEPFGLSVAEAIACGTPVIANRMGSMPELVLENETGIIVDNVDEAIERFNDVKKISPLKCREKGYSMFSMNQIAKEYKEVFQELVS